LKPTSQRNNEAKTFDIEKLIDHRGPGYMTYESVGLDTIMKDAIASVNIPENPFDVLYKTGQVFSLGNDREH
jgi:hypothetical protein